MADPNKYSLVRGLCLKLVFKNLKNYPKVELKRRDVPDGFFYTDPLSTCINLDQLKKEHIVDTYLLLTGSLTDHRQIPGRSKTNSTF